MVVPLRFLLQILLYQVPDGNLCIFAFQKNFEEAGKSFDKVLEISPSLPVAWSNRGEVFYNQGNYSEASIYYSKALELDSNLPEALAGRGDLFFKEKQYEEAITCYDKALQGRPDPEIQKKKEEAQKFLSST